MDNKELKRAELTCARVPNDVSEPCANENTENCERARQPSDRFCRPPAGATRDCAVSRVARLAQGSRASMACGRSRSGSSRKRRRPKMSRHADRSRSSAARQRRHHRRVVNGRMIVPVEIDDVSVPMALLSTGFLAADELLMIERR